MIERLHPMSTIVTEEHNFDTVNEKVAEAEFFLQRMAEGGSGMFGFRCYLSAFLAAARTTTLSLQRFRHVKGFDEWYEGHREWLKDDPTARFLLDLRNAHLHGGPSPVTRSHGRGGSTLYHFSSRVTPSGLDLPDVVTVCRGHLVDLLRIVHDAYVVLGPAIDHHQYYTREHFAASGRTIDDAEIEFYGFVRTGLVEDGLTEDDRWHELRGRFVDGGIQTLFYSYLGKLTPQPVEPDHYADFDLTPEERGWLYPPAGFKTVEAYWEHIGIEPPGHR